MDSIQSIRDEVNALVADRVLPLVIDKLKREHKNSAEGCDCNFCNTKRLASWAVGTSPRWLREEKRVVYRERLDRAFNEL